MSDIERQSRGAMDMTHGSPTRRILLFSLPLLVGNIFQQLYNMVDSVVVGQFVGSSALTAVSTGFPIIYLLSSLFIGFSMGATIMIAQYIGAGDRETAGRTVDTIYSALLAVIVPLTVLGVVVSGPLLTLIRVPAEAYDQARIYCMVVLGGIIGSLGYNLNAGILQGLGDSKTPLIFLAVACGINVALDLLFVLAFHWDVFGVALATIIAQFSSWVFGIFFINRKYPFIHIRFFQMKLDRRLLRQVVRLGIPSAIQECQFSVGILIMQALINGFGNSFAAGFGAANKIDTFAFMPIQSFSTATTTYVGQNIGAEQLDRVQKGARRALALGTLVCIAITAVVIPLRRPLLMLFNTEPDVVAAGEAYLLRVLTMMFILAMMFIFNAVLRGAGATTVPMVSSILSLWVVRVPAAYLLAHFLGPEELYWAYPIGWAVGLAISAAAYLRGRWRGKAVVGREPPAIFRNLGYTTFNTPHRRKGEAKLWNKNRRNTERAPRAGWARSWSACSSPPWWAWSTSMWPCRPSTSSPVTSTPSWVSSAWCMSCAPWSPPA